ncbi:DUF1573 domain-containing protein [Blastopirellula retiformator]|uniref:DUF1573 domain-containing protein n=1 Tax=Blastopirellula retiformator TaxID=2527970 RepID=A0A5C5VLV4_9BACT|nr:DUF1573 domain-containing protein [Blastopirellula retiformator]TWT38845.1 hypothetical protein Enr8_05390 [Blastopirellula retiformator]
MNKLPLLASVALILGLVCWFYMGEAQQTTPVSLTSSVPQSPTDSPSPKEDAQATKSPASPAPPQPQPKVSIEQDTFNFGAMERFEESSHVFVIKNEGDAPLQLTIGSSSCSCTIANRESDEAIPPGGSTEIKLDWEIKFKSGPFRQSASILTNDPDRPQFDLVVEGVIASYVAAYPEKLIISSIPLGNSERHDVIIYSMIWSDFDKLEVSSDYPDALVSVVGVEPVDVKSLGIERATAARRVTFEVSDKMPKGGFSLPFEIYATAPENETSKRKEERDYINVSGKVVGPFRIISDAIDIHGVIELGKFQQEDGKVLPMSFHVRNKRKNVEVLEVEAHPAFVTATLEPHSQQGREKGIYTLTITVPPDSPEGDFLAPNYGWIKIKTNHPRIDTMKFRLDFSVMSE